MTELEIAYFNYEHGGRSGAQDRFYSAGSLPGFTGLVRVAATRAGGRTFW